MLLTAGVYGGVVWSGSHTRHLPPHEHPSSSSTFSSSSSGSSSHITSSDSSLVEEEEAMGEPPSHLQVHPRGYPTHPSAV